MRFGAASWIIWRLLDGETVTHDGRFHSMRATVCSPRPVQSRLPIELTGSRPGG